MLIPSSDDWPRFSISSLSRRVNANSQLHAADTRQSDKLIKKGEC